MARVYATAEQYGTYTGTTAPADIVARLARASKFLDSRVFGLCWYDVDAEGLPSNAAVAAAFADACCAQVQWWEETGDEVGAASSWGNVSIGSVSLGSPRSSSSGSGGSTRPVAEAALEALRGPDMTPDVFLLGAVVTC